MNRRSFVELFSGAFAAGVLPGISSERVKRAGQMKSPGNESELSADVVIAGQE
jgi:hypothetical protein